MNNIEQLAAGAEPGNAGAAPVSNPDAAFGITCQPIRVTPTLLIETLEYSGIGQVTKRRHIELMHQFAMAIDAIGRSAVRRKRRTVGAYIRPNHPRKSCRRLEPKQPARGTCLGCVVGADP